MKRKVYKFYSLLILAVLFAGGLLYHNRPFRTRMGAYLTDLTDRTPAQRQNIERVGRTLSEVVLKPGETLSLNTIAGPYTTERGYQLERSFVGKGISETAGGGVCQVASTLYNAAMQSGLQVVERVPHSQDVVSVPKGRDATLAYGVADLKLKNQYAFPVQIRSRILTDQLLIEIWGKESRHVE